MLFNEPKLLKTGTSRGRRVAANVSVLFNEPKLLKIVLVVADLQSAAKVSVLFNEPKLLKILKPRPSLGGALRFSALQRAEIAENGDQSYRLDADAEFQCSSTSRNC